MEEYPKYVGNYPIEKLKINDWNPNEMDKWKMKRLKQSILDRKFIVPIVANTEGKISDGEHRYIATLELNKEGHNIKTVPVMVVDMDEDEMKMSTLGLNNIRGCDSPIKLAKMLQDLNQRHSLLEISEKIGYGAEEMKDKLELLKIPEDLLQQLKDNAKKQEGEMPSVLHFQVSKEQEKLILEALEKEKGKSNGEKLYQICDLYLKQKPENEKEKCKI